MSSAQSVSLRVDGVAVEVAASSTVLDACDAAGRYVPRLCAYPGYGCCGGDEAVPHAHVAKECGLCVIRLGDGSTALACATPATEDAEVTTVDAGLQALRLESLAPILARHPHVCLSCPDRDGCTREDCTYGNPPDARCCDEFGRCELGRLIGFVDAATTLPRRAVTAVRGAAVEGRIRREPGLCVACGRCVRICWGAREAGRALRADPHDGVALPVEGSFHASGCTFCGLCVLACPSGALTAPGEAGARWLAGRRERSGRAVAVLPPEERLAFSPEDLAQVPCAAGVLRLIDRQGQTLLIKGVADLRLALTETLADASWKAAAYYRTEVDPLYTQRESELLARYAQEHGHLPVGNDVGDDLY